MSGRVTRATKDGLTLLGTRSIVKRRPLTVRLLAACAATVAVVWGGTLGSMSWGPETSSSPSLSPRNAEGPPPLVTTSEDLGAVVRTFVAYQQWMLEHPDAADVNDLYPTDSVKGRNVANAIQGLEERGERFDCGAPPGVTIIDEPITIASSPKTVRVLAHIRRASCRLLDSSNRELTKQPAYARRAFNYTLQRTRDRWYVIGDDDLGDV